MKHGDQLRCDVMMMSSYLGNVIVDTDLTQLHPITEKKLIWPISFSLHQYASNTRSC